MSEAKGGKVTSLSCPVCGKEASEYEPNRWQCLTCGRKFAYEPEKQPDVYHRNEQVYINKMDDTSFFVCAKCDGKFPRQSYAEYKCDSCGNSFCADHMDKDAKMCKACSTKAGCGGCLVVIVVIIILVVIFG